MCLGKERKGNKERNIGQEARGKKIHNPAGNESTELESNEIPDITPSNEVQKYSFRPSQLLKMLVIIQINPSRRPSPRDQKM